MGRVRGITLFPEDLWSQLWILSTWGGEGYHPKGLCYLQGSGQTDFRLLAHFSHVQLFATLWTLTLQAPLSMGFSRQEYWSGLPCPLPGNLPNPGVFCVSRIEGGFFTHWATWKALYKGEEQAKLIYDFRSCKVIAWN